MDIQKMLLTPVEAATALGIGRSKVYELLRAGTASDAGAASGTRLVPGQPESQNLSGSTAFQVLTAATPQLTAG